MFKAAAVFVTSATAVFGLMSASASAQGTVCVGLVPTVGVNISPVPIPNFCPGEKKTLLISGTVTPGYSGTVAVGTGGPNDCALGIAPVTVQVTNGQFSIPVTATGPGFGRSATGYLCNLSAGNANPPTVTINGCQATIANSVVKTFSYNMKKPANCK